MNLQDLERARELLRASRSVCAFTGAGMSAESGIPTFRQSLDGLWARFSPQELATPEAFKRDPALVWGWYLWRMAAVRAAQPNAGHQALARLAAAQAVTIVTQNVDDLHERAGSPGVIHLHGDLFAHRCFACATRHAGQVVLPDLAAEEASVQPPACERCGGLIRPGVVWFGEGLAQADLDAAVRASRECDLMLVIGTTGLVHPAATLPVLAREAGARIIEINPDVSALSALADVCLRAGAAQVLPQLVGV